MAGAFVETATGLEMEVGIDDIFKESPPWLDKGENEDDLRQYLLSTMTPPTQDDDTKGKVEDSPVQTPPAASTPARRLATVSWASEEEFQRVLVAPRVEQEHQTRNDRRRSRQRAFLQGKVLTKRRDMEVRHLLGGVVAPLRVPPFHPEDTHSQGGVGRGPAYVGEPASHGTSGL